MASRKEAWSEVFAVVRLDRRADPGPESWAEDDGGLPGPPWITCGHCSVTVKEAVRTADAAIREVMRLNELNADRECRYFWQKTRLFPDGGSFGEAGCEDEGAL